MFKKMLASVGIGSAKIDTVLQTETLKPGELIQAQIFVKGGKVEQSISGIELSLMTEVQEEMEDEEGEVQEYESSFEIERWHIAEKFTLVPGEERVFDFEAVLHPETPITTLECRNNKSHVWLQTGLEIDVALDASDRDYINILPNHAMSCVIDAMHDLGFELVKTDVEKGYINSHGFETRSGCYQELEFKPARMGLWGFNEVEVSFVSNEQQTSVMLEIDRVMRRDGYQVFTIFHGEYDFDGVKQHIEELLN